MRTIVGCATVIVRSMALALIAVVWAGPVSAAASDRAALVAEGETWWTSSPDPRDPVGCATCHHDRDETREWAASFPKFRPLPPGHPIWTVPFKNVNPNEFPLWGLDVGCKTVVVLSEKPMAGSWEEERYMPKEGQPVYINGVRGMVERNAMRYYLAIEAYFGAMSAPTAQQQQEKRLHDWFALTEEHPRQLHEMERDEYLAIKRRELATP